ncbi:PAS domain-containing protein [Halodurantibacterium flavum]|uniref:PAS domain-containing protein n=1 Tax=Halodurantibacterium flavum TaxID=1382802 RepID=A0ABW4S6B8_9RHOB
MSVMPDRMEVIRGVFERSPVALTLADLDREDAPLLLANDRFARLTGYGASEMIGKNCRFLQRPGENEQACADVRGAMESFREVQVVFRNYRKNGEQFDNLLFLHPIDGPNGARYMLGSQFELVPQRPGAMQGAATHHVAGLSDDLARLTRLSEQLHAERRRHMAAAAASLVATWMRNRRI